MGIHSLSSSASSIFLIFFECRQVLHREITQFNKTKVDIVPIVMYIVPMYINIMYYWWYLKQKRVTLLHDLYIFSAYNYFPITRFCLVSATGFCPFY